MRHRAMVIGVFAGLAVGISGAQEFDCLWGYFDEGTARNYLGHAVAGVGDVDGDGTPDLLVGAPGADPAGVYSAGSAFLFSGEDGRLLLRLDAVDNGDRLGFAASGAGDLNGDGVPDLALGALGLDPAVRASEGRISIFSGRDGSQFLAFFGRPARHYLSRPVLGMQDLNADGIPDLVVGGFQPALFGPDLRASAFAISSTDGEVLASYDGEAAVALLASAASNVGDVNRDGTPDLIVGVPTATAAGLAQAGSAYVLSGADGTALLRFDGQEAGARFGIAVSGAGDVDADGIPDLIVGAWRAGASGSAMVFSGADGHVLLSLEGEAAGDQFGVAVAGAGDVDGDGHADVIVGAPHASPRGISEAGMAYVFSGASGQPLYVFNGAAVESSQSQLSCPG